MIGGKLEKQAFEILKNNSEIVLEVVKKFEEVVRAYFKEWNLEKAEKLGRELSSLETRADKGRRDFIALLTRGAFIPAFRGDLAWLAERLDRVADTAEGAMRTLLLRESLIKELKSLSAKNKRVAQWKEKFMTMAGVITQTAEMLSNSVKALERNVDEAIRIARSVDDLEHEVDLIEHEIVEELYEMEKLFKPLSVVQLAEIIRRMGNIADRAEDMSDSIAILGLTLTT
ncbi:MAG: DUF47 family protein [Candidatus Hadarchaeales archaeon]